ncbi:hypothetical protein R1flu_009981 [Riccia fluitans]|uniref:Uncharacterized protein n=1 Tax=Riccia fluitans TaxID=41844 RepID=A0ABD1Z697_9MARC
MEHCKVATCLDDYTVRVWTLKTPRFSEKTSSKYSESGFEHPEVESSAPRYSFLDLRLEDSQHQLQGKLSQRGKRLMEAHIDRDMNTLRLVEDSQHALPASQLRSLPEDFATVDDNHGSVAAGRFCIRREPEYFSEGDIGIHDEFFGDSEDKSAKDFSLNEDFENTSEARYAEVDTDLKNEQVSPPFKRSRVPLRELNSDGLGNRESECSTAPEAEQFREFLEDSTTFMEQNKPPTDKHSTPLNSKKKKDHWTISSHNHSPWKSPVKSVKALTDVMAAFGREASVQFASRWILFRTKFQDGEFQDMHTSENSLHW